MHITYTLHAHEWCRAKVSSYRSGRGDSGHDFVIVQRDSSAIIYELITRVTLSFDNVVRQGPWRQPLAILARLYDRNNKQKKV
jgi:hypothetical protein